MNILKSFPGGQAIYIQGRYTYFYAIGPKDGFPIILLHGFLSSSYAWRGVWSALAKEHRVYLIDLPGYGKSQSSQSSYSVDSYSEFIKEFFQNIGIDKAIVVGTQMGGSIAAWFAAKYPDCVKSLVIMAAGAMGEKQTNMWLYRLVASKIIGRIAVRFFPFKLFAQRWRAACVNKEIITDDIILTYFRDFQKNGHTQTRIGLQVRASYGSKFEKFEAAMKRIEAPTLLIWGENDPLVPLSTGNRFKQSIRESQLVVIPNCGDFPHEEYPDVVSYSILNFI